MLGRMIFAGQGLRVPNSTSGAADYIVTSDAEWDAVFANSAATLAGKIVEVQGSNFTPRTIYGKDMDAEGGRLTIRSANSSASLPSILLNGVTRGIDFSGLNFQMTGWPYTTGSCFVFNNGTFGKLRFLNGTTFRHGYGAGLTDIDTSATLAEYERIDNVQTATTTSATYALTWKDPAFNNPGGNSWIEFFNRGANSVRVAIGGSGVVATGSSQLVAAGARFRFTSLAPTTDTHFAVLATSGTSEVNARTEIGLSNYLAAAFSSSGAATLEDIEIRGCLFRDLRDGIKGLNPDTIITMDNDLDRIYQDVISVSPKPDGFAYHLRNIECIPFARSGIAENLNGDARDPHGDQFQMFGNASGTIGPVYYAGNRIRPGALRAGVNQQGIFISDNDVTPSYEGIYIVSTMQIGGGSRSLDVGEAGWPARNVMVYGATVVDSRDVSATAPVLQVFTDQGNSVYVGSAISPNIGTSGGAAYIEEDTLRLSAAADRAAVFPNIGDLPAATTRAEIEAAMTTAAEGAGLGAVATANAIDWTTANHEAVILWQNIPSGAYWDAPAEVDASTVVTLPLRKILNRRASQTVSVGTGTEWRSVASDGTTEVQAWTNASGTIEPDQFIQIRRTSSATGGDSVTASATVNGFDQSVTITTADAPANYLIKPANGYFQDTAGIGAGVSRITMRGKFRFPSLLPGTAGMGIFSGVSTPLRLTAFDDGSLRARVEDSTGAAVYDATIAPAGTVSPNTWYTDVELDVNHATEQVRVTFGGADYTAAFTASGTGSFQSSRSVMFLADSGGGAQPPEGTFAADMSVDFGGVPRKAISNDAAAANADAWKLGAGSFTNVP